MSNASQKKKLVSTIPAELKYETRNSYYRLQHSDIYSTLFNVRVTDRYILQKSIEIPPSVFFGFHYYISFIF